MKTNVRILAQYEQPGRTVRVLDDKEGSIEILHYGRWIRVTYLHSPFAAYDRWMQQDYGYKRTF